MSMSCPPACPDMERHCFDHCPACLANREANAAEVKLFEAYLASRPQPEHARTWNV